MNFFDAAQIFIFLILIFILSPILGLYISKVFRGERTIVHRVFFPVEKIIYRISGVAEDDSMCWKRYLVSLLLFNAAGFVFLFLVLSFQNYLPLNPGAVPGMSSHLAFNTAVSFMTNTNWQAYSGEVQVSYLSQMIGLAVWNFLSAATGISVAVAFIRALGEKERQTIGNYWVDMTRSVVYVLLPLSFIVAVILLSQGVVQSFSPYVTADAIEGGKQILPLGPAASQIAIKQIGTNGGGFFGVNSAHPFENPTPISNLVEMISIIIISSSLVFAFGRMLRSKAQGYVLYAAMLILFIGGLSVSLYSEYHVPAADGAVQIMEGKETRFGSVNSVLWSEVTTCTSNGSINSMHDSLSPLSGFVLLFNMMIGEVIFGGVGSGLYGILMFVIITVFIAGLMVGRTPEYLGKKIEKREIQMAILAVILPSFVILIFSAIACVLPAGVSSLANRGPHGLSEILYAFSSAAGNNGSAFAGLSVNTPFYNMLTGIGMLIGRFGVIIPSLAIAGSFAAKRHVPETPGTFRTDSPVFVVLLIAVIILIGALTFFPALLLGPVAEHILSVSGKVF